MEGYKPGVPEEPKKETMTGAKAVFAAAALAMGLGAHNAAEAGVSIDTAQSNPDIQRVEQSLQERGLDVIVQVLKGGYRGLTLKLRDKNGVEFLDAQIGNSAFAQIAPLLTPERVSFEQAATKVEKDRSLPMINEMVNSTSITITPYGQSLMKYMGIRYNKGIMEFPTGLSVNLTGENATANESVEIRGVQLENKLTACVTEHASDNAQKVLMYYFSKEGERFEITEASYKEMIQNCKLK